MNLFKRIRAFFNFRGQCAEVELSAAEVKKGKVYLHPVDDPEHTYCIKSDNIAIVISPNADITEDDVEIIEQPQKSEKEKQKEDEKEKKKRDTSQRERNENDPFKMRKMTISLYPDEYDALMDNIKSNGYRKTEFLLACVECAKKNSMEATYKRYTQEHKRRKAEAKMAMKEAKEE